MLRNSWGWEEYRMTKFVGIVSGKGGVAKTSSTLALGAALHQFGREVVVVDGNLSTPNLGLHLGIMSVPINLHDVLKGRYSITEAVYRHSSGLKIVPAGLSLRDLSGVNPHKLKEVLPGLRGLADLVIVDGAAGLGNENLAVLEAVDDVLVVSHPEIPSLTDALKTIKISESLGKRVKGVILTKTGNSLDLSVDAVERLLETEVIAVIPDDKAMRESLVKKNAVVFSHPKSKSAIAYKKLAAELIGLRYNEKRGFIDWLLRR